MKIFIVLTTLPMIAMMSIVYAGFMQDWDTDSGDYTIAEAYCSGNMDYQQMKLCYAYAHVKGTVDTALPDDGIVVKWRFVTDKEDTGWWYSFDGRVDEPEEWLKTEYSPGTVAYIVCYGQVGYGHIENQILYYTMDTDQVSASLPFL